MVFDHAVEVFEGLERVLKLDFLPAKTRVKIEKHLAKKVGKYSRKELLKIGVILHDLAKKDVLIRHPSGNTTGFGHEIIGSLMVRKFALRFGLDKKGRGFVERFVHYHGLVSDIVGLVIAKKNQAKYLGWFKEIVGDIDIELFLFIYADWLGSHLKKLNPKEYEVREKAVVRLLEAC